MITHCETCGAGLKKYWHRVTPGMVKTLIKARRHVDASQKNEFHLYKDLTGDNALTTVEQMNWTKLRFHGLVAKVKRNGEWEYGYWLITKRGGQFLKGEIAIPHRVQTFRNKVVAHDSTLVYIKDVIGEMPYFDNNIEFEYADEEDLEKVPAVVVNKKKKMTCPVCKDKLVSKIETGEPIGDRIPVRKFLVCANKAGCTYRVEVDL